MKIVFRADASLDIGTGHVMRCLTLADALRRQGAKCSFICRDLPGHLAEAIRSRQYDVALLPQPVAGKTVTDEDGPPHAAWLGVPWSLDMEQTRHALSGKAVEWLVVDHYALDARWQAGLRSDCQRLMVIDDLADRPHLCDLLLDQNLGRKPEHYGSWVPSNCQLLCGAQYALLRPEFSTLRANSLLRRHNPVLRQLLITMGGVDKANATTQVLRTLCSCELPEDCQITVVMGSSAPWIEEVKGLLSSMPWQTRVLIGVSDMAQLMANSDLAIGASGATSWERCCVGLPTIMIPLADNQNQSCVELASVGAGLMIGNVNEIGAELPKAIHALVQDPQLLHQLSANAALVTDGDGVERLMAFIR